MTDKRDELIEKVARLIHQNYSETAWAEVGYTDRVWAEGTARKVLAVFEQAKTPTTPTDDEREPSIEEVTAAFQEHEGAPTWQDDPVARDAALRWHMRGFKDGLNARRTVQGEPTRPLTPCGNRACTGCRVCGCSALGIEPQREPTDSEAWAAAGAVATLRRQETGAPAWFNVDHARAALRGAAAVTSQEGSDQP